MLQHRTNNVSGHPNISIIPLKKGGTRYHVRIYNRGVEVFNKCFRDLESAIKARDEAFSYVEQKKPESVSVVISDPVKYTIDYVDKAELKFNDPKIHYHRNGFISVNITWAAKNKENSFKYLGKSNPFDKPTDRSTYTLHFKNSSFVLCDVEVKLTTGPNDKKYEALYHECHTEYSATIWFAPVGWQEFKLAEEVINSEQVEKNC